MADKVEVAVEKRIRIDRTKQQIMLMVLAASLVTGLCLVLSVFFIKYINFNNKVIKEKDASIANYNTTIKNVGICIDKNKDGTYTDDELESCDPETVDVKSLPNTLRYNVLVEMANNQDLESVGREALSNCYHNGKKRDFAEAYYKAADEKSKLLQLQMLKMCSSLRAVPDALPASKNEEALMASLNQVFRISNYDPEALSPAGGSPVSTIEGVGVIPVSLSIPKTKMQKTMEILQNIERSIRTFQVTSASIKWSSNEDGENMLELSAQANSYYAEEKEAVEETKTVYASNKAKKSAKGSSE